MTSQKYLNDRTNLKDFLRSIMDAVWFAIIAFVVLLMEYAVPTIEYVADLKSNPQKLQWLKETKVISFFGTMDASYYETESIFSVGMVLCGILMAIALFSFAFKKKSVNVYFSMGITRVRLFVNRSLAAILLLFASTFLPIFIAFITNVVTFGFHTHQVAVMLYLTFSLFLSGVAGFSIGALAAAVSGSRIEMGVTTFSLSVLGALLYSLFEFFKVEILRGYFDYYISSNSFGDLLSPWTFITNLGKANEYDMNLSNPLSYMSQLITGDKVPEALTVTKGLIIPLLVWFVISAVLLGIGLYLFKIRKNENSNSVGKFYISSAINGAFAFTFLAAWAIDFSAILYKNEHKTFLAILVFVLVTFIGFVIAEAIIRRNIKAIIKTLPVYGVLLLVSIIALVVVSTGYFGTYNKLPDMSKVEYISMSYNDPLSVFDYDPAVYMSTTSKIHCQSSDAEDIKLCYEYFNKAKDDKFSKDSLSTKISFAIKTKDGKTIVRSFEVYSPDLIHDYNKAVFNSNYFSEVVKYKLESRLKGENLYQSAYVVDEMPFDNLYYFDSTLIAGGYSFNGEIVGAETLHLDSALINALVSDFKNISYDDYYCPKDTLIGAISPGCNTPVFKASRYEIDDNRLEILDNFEEACDSGNKTVSALLGNSTILICSKMTKTNEYLSEYEPLKKEANAEKALVIDKGFDFASAINSLVDEEVYGSAYAENCNRLFVSGSEYNLISFTFLKSDVNIPREGSVIDLIKAICANSNVNVKTIEDPQKAQEIESASYGVYDTYEDKGQFVYIIYDDGSIIGRFVPEANLSVLN